MELLMKNGWGKGGLVSEWQLAEMVTGFPKLKSACSGTGKASVLADKGTEACISPHPRNPTAGHIA